MKKDFDDRKFIRDRVALLRELRAQARFFPGLENVFAGIEEGMLRDFKEAALIKHAGDKGDAREEVLRTFLSGKRYLPRRFGVSEGSSHIVSPSGRRSSQTDLVLFDADNSPRLLDKGHIQYFPVECVYGVIEVKSDLNSKDTVHDGLQKVASFKQLYADAPKQHVKFDGQNSQFGFGVLFAFDASLAWSTLVDAVREWQAKRPSTEWPNMVVVLNQGLLLQADDRKIRLHTEDIAKVAKPALHPVLADDSVLLGFYLMLMDLLTSIELPHFSARSYVNIPALVDGRQVVFTRGAFSEVGACRKHGPYLRELLPGAADSIIAACASAAPVLSWEAVDEAYGTATAVGGKDRGYPVRIYNPEKEPASAILLIDQHLHSKEGTQETQALGFEELAIDGAIYWVPAYYEFKHKLITECPKCEDDGARTMSAQQWREMCRQANTQRNT